MSEQNITIDELARMIKGGFDGVDQQINGITTEMREIKSEMNDRFDKIDDRFDKIERLILSDHKQRIEYLEVELSRIKQALAF